MGNLASVEFTQNTCAAGTGRPTVVLQPTRHGENTKAWATTTFYRDTSVLDVSPVNKSPGEPAVRKVPSPHPPLTPMPNNNDKPKLTVKNSQLPVTEALTSPVRASKRNAATVDQDSMEKATKLKARKNLDDATNKCNSSQNLSFNKLVDSDIIARTSSLGVVLGKTEDAVLSTVKSLREIEITRMNESVSLKEGKINNLDEVTTECSIDKGIDLQALNFLCSEITDCLCDGGCDPTDYRPLYHIR